MTLFYLKAFDQMSLTELYQVLKFRADIFIVEQDCIYTDLDNKDQTAKHLMAYKNEKLVAYARILNYGSGTMSIGRVTVVKELRGKGLGKQLMEFAIQLVYQSFGANKIDIIAQHYLEQYYQSLGFKTTSKPYMWDGILHIDMIHKRV